jgi:phage-related minor tail protein
MKAIIAGTNIGAKGMVMIFMNMKKVVMEIFLNIFNGFSDMIEKSVNFLIRETNSKFGSSFSEIQTLKLTNTYAGSGDNLLKDLTGLTIEEIASASAGLDEFGKKLNSNTLKSYSDRVNKDAGDPNKTKLSKGGSTAEKKDPIAELFKNADADIAAIRAETAQIGLYGKELAYAAAQAKLLADAKAKGLTDEQIKAIMPQINDKARQYSSASEERDRKKFLEEQSVAFARSRRELEQQTQMLGMTAEETLRYKNYQDLLNDALDKHIELTEADKNALKEQSDAMTQSQITLKKLQEQMEFTKTVSKGLFDDFRNGLKQGQTLWESFANAAINALNKILDKLADQAFDQFFNGLSDEQKSGGKIGSFIFNGGGIGGGQAKPFAKGGVVNKPTMFAYGGVQRGIMGEAGPEAIMPLKRGPNGSLGVEMHGSRQASTPTNVTVPIYVGGEKIDERIIQISGTVAREITGKTIASAAKSSARSQSYRLG